MRAVIKSERISLSKQNTSILKDVSLNIEPGKLYVIIGPNGAGKSTLLKVLAKEESADKGNIYLKGKDLQSWEDETLSLHKAKFSQEFNPSISLKVSEVVMMGRYPYFDSHPRDIDREIVEEKLKKVDLGAYKNRFYNSLSGGEKQRVHLARILAQLQSGVVPKITFFDEPLNNLDIRHQHRILEEIKDFAHRGNSAVIVLHDLNLTAEFADRIILMKQGQVIAQGSSQEIFTSALMQRAYDFPCVVCSHPISQCPLVVFKGKGRYN